jgi:hypothetical protein
LENIFTLQEKIITITVGARPRTSCRSQFKKLEILLIPCQYTLSLMNFIVNNQETFQSNLSTYNIKIWTMHPLCRPNANLFCFQRSTFYPGIRIFYNLPSSLTTLKNEKAKFKAALRKQYSVDKFLMCTDDL